MMRFNNTEFSKYFSSHGDSRFATKEEIEASCKRVELNNKNIAFGGMPIINDGKVAFVDDKDNHSLIFGSTGSKKTRLFCMPTLQLLLAAGESVVVTDPKGELFNRTSGTAKKNGYDVVVLNYRELERSDMWNPLALPYKLFHSGDKEAAVARINDFVNTISEKQESHTNDIFWVNAAKSIALSILITMLELCTFDECNLKTFTRFCIEFAKGVTDPLMVKAYNLDDEDIVKNNLAELMKIIPEDHIARLNYEGLASSSEKAKGDIQSSLFSLIGVFMTQEALVRNMSNTSFDINSIGTKKTAVYLIVPDERTSFHFIATTFIKQCYELLIIKAQKQESKQLPVRVNFLLDEFANMPHIPDMPTMISAARSRNIRFYLVLQSMHQLKKKYGDDAETLKGNCENWVFLASREINLLSEISKLCGEVNVDGLHDSRKDALISTSQLQRLSKEKGEALIFYGRQYPFITEMADIDDCEFPQYEKIEIKKKKLLAPISIDPKTMLEQIVEGKRKTNFPVNNAEQNIKTDEIDETEEDYADYDFSDFFDEELDDDDFYTEIDTEDHVLFISEIMALSENKEPLVLGHYDILENEDGDFLFVLPVGFEISDEKLIGAKLYYDGKSHAVLKCQEIEPIICDYIQESIREKIVALDSVLILFVKQDESGGYTPNNEFYAEMKYIPDIPLSNVVQLFVDKDIQEPDVDDDF